MQVAWPRFAEDLIRGQPFLAGSIDRTLLNAQVLLARETRSALYDGEPPPAIYRARPRLRALSADITGAHPQRLAQIFALTRWCSRVPRRYPYPERSTAGGYYGDFRGFQWGGTEEQIIAKGSPWPQELARVLMRLLQVSGIPARLVFLFGDGFLHAVVEAWVMNHWTVCDPCANRCYIWPHHGYASAWELQQQPKLVDQTPEHGRNRYVDSRLYKTIGIVLLPLAMEVIAQYARRAARPEDLPLLAEAAAVFAEP